MPIERPEHCGTARYSLCPTLNVVLTLLFAIQVQTKLQASRCIAIQVQSTLHAPGNKLERRLKWDRGSRSACSVHGYMHRRDVAPFHILAVYMMLLKVSQELQRKFLMMPHISIALAVTQLGSKPVLFLAPHWHCLSTELILSIVMIFSLSWVSVCILKAILRE